MIMEHDHIIEILPLYLDGALDPNQKQRVQAHLEECSTCNSELKKLKILFAAFEEEKLAFPSERLTARFLENLEREKREVNKGQSINTTKPLKKHPWRSLFKVAASIALLIGAFMLGKYHQIQKTKINIPDLRSEGLVLKNTAMLSLMEDNSASKRIQGVSDVEGITKPDEVILKALTDRMLNDDNANVRLTAVSVLTNFTDSELVKDGFIKALKTEQEAGIQMTIIRILVKIQEKKAVAPMQRLLSLEKTQPFVKDQIKSLLPSII